jgi:hypothetical protein
MGGVIGLGVDAMTGAMNKYTARIFGSRVCLNGSSIARSFHCTGKGEGPRDAGWGPDA